MLVITPVGTSLIERCRQEERSLDTQIAYLREEPAAAWEKSAKRVEATKKILRQWASRLNSSKKPEMAAEVKSLLKTAEKLGQKPRVQLLATDTVLSRLAAEVLEQVLKDYFGFEVSFKPAQDVIRGLQVRDARQYRKEGLPNLVKRVHELINAAGAPAAVNVTGGYKALIPYLTIVGQIYSLPLYYIFEDTDELIEIPPVPLDLRWELFLRYGDALKELASGVYDWEDFRHRRNLPNDLDPLIWKEENMAELNAVGIILWGRFDRCFLVEVRRGCGYEKEGPGERREIDQALQELYRRLDEEVRSNSLRTTEDLVKRIRSLGEQHDLRHGPEPDRDKFVFKSTARGQVRLVYAPRLEPGGLVLRLFDYRRGGFDHDTYLREFKAKAALWRGAEFVTLTLPKP